MIKFIKLLFCNHKSEFVYDGISGGMGFLFRNMHCNDCGKKFSILTYTKPHNDRYKKGQILTTADCESFNNEVL